MCVRGQTTHVDKLLYQGERCGDHSLRGDKRSEDCINVNNPEQWSVVFTRNGAVEDVRDDIVSVDDELRTLTEIGQHE